MTFYIFLPPEEQGNAVEHMLELLYDYLPEGTSSTKVAQAMCILNPYVRQGRAIGFSQQDQERVLDWLQKR